MKNKFLKITAFVLLSFTIACNDDFVEADKQETAPLFNQEVLTPQQINEEIIRLRGN